MGDTYFKKLDIFKRTLTYYIRNIAFTRYLNYNIKISIEENDYSQSYFKSKMLCATRKI